MHRWLAWCYLLLIPTFANLYSRQSSEFGVPLAAQSEARDTTRLAQHALNAFVPGWIGIAATTDEEHRAFLLAAAPDEVRFVTPIWAGERPGTALPEWTLRFPQGCAQGQADSIVQATIDHIPLSLIDRALPATWFPSLAPGSSGQLVGREPGGALDELIFTGDVVIPTAVCQTLVAHGMTIAPVASAATPSRSDLWLSAVRVAAFQDPATRPRTERARQLVWLQSALGTVVLVLAVTMFGSSLVSRRDLAEDWREMTFEKGGP